MIDSVRPSPERTCRVNVESESHSSSKLFPLRSFKLEMKVSLWRISLQRRDEDHDDENAPINWRNWETLHPQRHKTQMISGEFHCSWKTSKSPKPDSISFYNQSLVLLSSIQRNFHFKLKQKTNCHFKTKFSGVWFISDGITVILSFYL